MTTRRNLACVQQYCDELKVALGTTSCKILRGRHRIRPRRIAAISPEYGRGVDRHCRVWRRPRNRLGPVRGWNAPDTVNGVACSTEPIVEAEFFRGRLEQNKLRGLTAEVFSASNSTLAAIRLGTSYNSWSRLCCILALSNENRKDMSVTDPYTPPKIWQWNKDSGGKVRQHQPTDRWTDARARSSGRRSPSAIALVGNPERSQGHGAA